MGLSDDRSYARYHQVLNRAVWSPRQAAPSCWAANPPLDQGDGPLIFGIDETLERRRGPKIKSLGIYRDAVRSSRSQVVKASGLRWISLMWLGQVPWADVIGPCPFSPCWRPRHATTGRGRHHKKLTDWARQMILQLRRWLPQRPLVLVGDSRPYWTCSTAANRWRNPLSSSPACAWTPPFMNRRQHVSRAGTVGPR